MNQEVEMDQEEPMQEEIVLSRHHVQKLHSQRLSSARIRRRLACVVLPLALSGHLAACSMQTDFSKGAIDRAAENGVRVPFPPTVPKTGSEWSGPSFADT